MIYDKPFSFQEMLRRTIFKGRPNFFNAKDMNKELLIIHRFMEEFNKRFCIISDVKITVSSFTETFSVGDNKYTRDVSISWTAGKILYNGVEFDMPAGGTPTNFVQVYTAPNTAISPKEIKPPTYICLTGELDLVTYGDNPVLCGIQGDEIPTSVPTVDVEQYKNLGISLSTDPSMVDGILGILAVIHPRYKEDGSEDGFGFLYYTMNNPDFKMNYGNGNSVGSLQNNRTLFEYIVERFGTRLTYLLNERQLIRRFNLADILDFGKSRHNIGFSNLVNHRQLVREENLKDLENKEAARYNLGLGSSATRNIGNLSTHAAPGNIVPVGGIIMWSGAVNDIPTGWVICDGSNNTPDLRGRFIAGYSSASAEFNLVGKTGGGATTLLTKEMLPKHAHTFSGTTDHDGAHTHSQWAGNGSKGSGFDKGNSDDERFYPHPNNQNTSKHSHHFSGTTDFFGGDTNGNQTPLNTLPPYYVLCFIMYKGIEPIGLATPTQPTLVYPNFSEPNGATDNGYSNYTPVNVGGSGGQTVGSGIILTNPD